MESLFCSASLAKVAESRADNGEALERREEDLGGMKIEYRMREALGVNGFFSVNKRTGTCLA